MFLNNSEMGENKAKQNENKENLCPHFSFLHCFVLLLGRSKATLKLGQHANRKNSHTQKQTEFREKILYFLVYGENLEYSNSEARRLRAERGFLEGEIQVKLNYSKLKRLNVVIVYTQTQQHATSHLYDSF